MKVLFIGGTGLISSAVTELSVKKGFDVYVLNRGNKNTLLPDNVKTIQADIRDKTKIKASLDRHNFDCVVEWIGYTPVHIQQDIELFRGITGQYIFISSASAYQKPPTHYLVDESTPLSNPYWQYSRNKIACENLLMEEYRTNRFPVTIVRPSYTYNKTTIPFVFNSHRYPWTIVDRIRRGEKIIVPGDGTSLWTLTHSSDFATGFVGLIGNPGAIGHTFHITSDEVLTWDQIAETIGIAAGARPNIIHIPSEFIAAASPDSEGGLIGDKSVSVVFDNSKIKRFVPGFKAVTPFRLGIEESIRYYESKPELLKVDEEFNKLCDWIISCYEEGLNKVRNLS